MARAKKSTPKKKTKATPKKKGRDPVLVGSKVKAAIKANGCNTAGDALEGLNQYVYWLIEQATARAIANKRKTVKAHDFVLM